MGNHAVRPSQEISLDLKTGVSDVTVGAPEQISLQDSIDRSRQLAEALRRTAWADSSTSSGGGSSGGGSRQRRLFRSGR